VTTGALLLSTAAQPGPFMIGAAALALLLIGIRNAWDAVTHIVVTRADSDAIDSNT